MDDVKRFVVDNAGLQPPEFSDYWSLYLAGFLSVAIAPLVETGCPALEFAFSPVDGYRMPDVKELALAEHAADVAAYLGAVPFPTLWSVVWCKRCGKKMGGGVGKIPSFEEVTSVKGCTFTTMCNGYGWEYTFMFSVKDKGRITAPFVMSCSHRSGGMRAASY